MLRKLIPQILIKDFKSYMNMVFAYCGTLFIGKRNEITKFIWKWKIGDAFN